MADLINLLQTITLLAGLCLSVTVLFMIVYFLGKLASAFETLLKAIEKIGKEHAIVPVRPTKEPEDEIDEPEPAPPANQAVEPQQYHCETCNAKLPLMPKHSVIKDTITLLVFKCRRCGKETEVDPAKGQPK
jgi:DNA-directed RNA polymerase subunit RPC12/RpoP